jgi:transglutaminase-like putative cysteine protease
MATKRLQWGVLALLLIGCTALDLGQLLAWLSFALLLLTALKLVEARGRRERRLVALLQLLVCGLLAAQQPQLLPSLLQMLATLGALAGLLQQSLAAGLSWRQLLLRSLRLLGAVLPLALLLWLLMPRLGPFGRLPARLGGRATVGLSRELDPGSIAELAGSEVPAARVSFSRGLPPPPAERSWRVLVHSSFDGQRWLPASPPLPRLRRLDPAPGAPNQLWKVEPGPVQAMPWDGRSLPAGADAWIDASGTLQLSRPADSSRTLLLVRDPRAIAWQQLPPTMAEQTLPWGGNPRLEALGRSWRALPPPQRLAAARRLLASGAFRYSRQPGTLPRRAGLDVFLFERRLGFCGHYASAFSALMRAAGVPARVVSGYQGGTWLPLLAGGGVLELRQSDAHAWSEVWIDGRWQAVDPSAWVGSPAAAGPVASSRWWWRRLEAQWWGAELLWSRWWLGFDASRQRQLLAWLTGDRPAVVGGSALLLGGALLWIGRRGLERAGSARRPDRLARQLRRWRQRLGRQGVAVRPGETLPQLARRLASADPRLAEEARRLAVRHERQRYGIDSGRGCSRRRPIPDP